jgi:hypothetical protein
MSIGGRHLIDAARMSWTLGASEELGALLEIVFGDANLSGLKQQLNGAPRKGQLQNVLLF